MIEWKLSFTTTEGKLVTSGIICNHYCISWFLEHRPELKLQARLKKGLNQL